MIIKHSNGDINQLVQHEPTHDPNNGRFQNLRRSSLLRLLTASYKGRLPEELHLQTPQYKYHFKDVLDIQRKAIK